MYKQLLRQVHTKSKNKLFHIGSYEGASISDPAKKLYEKISFPNMIKENLNRKIQGGWIAMQEHYFLSAWIANPKEEHHYYTHAKDHTYIIGMLGPKLTIAPHQTRHVSSSLFVGPELTDVLKGIAPGLNLTVDYGWLWFISMFLFG